MTAERTPDNPPEAWANSQLASAAPDLYAAAERTLQVLEEEIENPNVHVITSIHLLSAALRKARGEK